MARSQVRHNVKDAAGNVVQNALCYVYETGTTTPVADLFAASSGGSALPSLTSDAQGDIVGWLDVARTVDVKVTDNSNTAYYPSTSSRLLSWTDFTESVEIAPTQGAVDASAAAEAALRASADTSEATTRATADTTNASAITAEATARAAADTAHNINAGAHTNLPYALKGKEYWVEAYGAVGDGVTDDSTAFAAAVAAVIATGGTLYATAPSYNLVNSGLDFSAMKSATGAKPVRFVGAGGGTGQPASAYIPTFGAATVLLNGTGAECIKANGTATTQPIVGLTLLAFAIKNTADLASGKFTISTDLVAEQLHMDDVYVYANGHGGNGIACMNMPLGQSRWGVVIVQGFNSVGPDGVSYKWSNEVTANVPTAPNSGNFVGEALVARDTRVAYYFLGTTLLNGITLISPKAVNTSATRRSGSIAYYFNGAAHQNVLIAPHSEMFDTAYAFSGAKFNSVISPLAAFTGTSDANSAGVRCYGTATGNTISNLRATGLNYGASFEDNAQSNEVSGDDAAGGGVLTAFFPADASTLKTNITRKIEHGTTKPVINFAGHVLSAGATIADPFNWGFASMVNPGQAFTLQGIGTSNRTFYGRLITGATISKIGFQVGVQSGSFWLGAFRGTGIGRANTPAGGLLAYAGSSAARTVADAVTTSGSPTVTSATAAFVSTDVGKIITGSGIPANTYVGVINSATSIGLSSTTTTNTPVNATATASSVSITLATGIAVPGTGYLEVALNASVTVYPGDWLALGCDNTTATFYTVNSGLASNLVLGMGAFTSDTSLPTTPTGFTWNTARLPILIGIP